ncbi:MAG: sugar ABC transporter substrate-binding protein [Spartobacteria bacterium]|nr:sugar ABC transporter substrate-binding protein [Spartobacteria bacterium]
MKKIMNALMITALATGSLFVQAAQASDGHYKFGFTCMDQSNPFFVLIEKTIREKVEARGDKLISVDPANDVMRQVQQIEDVVAQNIDGMFLNPAEAEGIIPALDILKDAGIPIVNFDTEVADMSYVTTYDGSDNYNAGFVCGEDLVKKIPNGGDIIVLDSPTMNSVVDRTKGFLKAIEGKGFNIVAQQDAKGNLEKSMNIAEDLLQANPDVVAIFGGNDPTALGALAAANAAGIKECLIYGVDGSPDIKREIASGTSLIEGSGAQSPISIANVSVDLMYKIMAGEKVDSRYPVPTFLITSENVEEFGIDGWQ